MLGTGEAGKALSAQSAAAASMHKPSAALYILHRSLTAVNKRQNICQICSKALCRLPGMWISLMSSFFLQLQRPYFYPSESEGRGTCK